MTTMITEAMKDAVSVSPLWSVVGGEVGVERLPGDPPNVLLGADLGQTQGVVLVGRGVDLLDQQGLLVWPHVDVLQLVPDGHLAHLELLGAELRPENHLAEDLHSGLQTPAVHTGRVQKCVPGALTVANT